MITSTQTETSKIVENYWHQGWGKLPTYRCKTSPGYSEVAHWMRENGIGYKLVSSGSNGYVFQVYNNNEWFMLKWL